MNKIVFPVVLAVMLGIGGCQSSTSDSASSTQTQKSAPAEFELGGKKIFFTANSSVEQRNSYSGTNKGSFSETSNRTATKAVLIRQVGDKLLVADPDNQAGTVFVNGQSVRSSGGVAAKGRTNCVNLQIEEGYQRNICSSYTYRNGIVEIKDKETDPAENRTTTRTYRFSYSGSSCKFIGYSANTNVRNAYCDGPCLFAYGPNTKWRISIKETASTGQCSIR